MKYIPEMQKTKTKIESSCVVSHVDFSVIARRNWTDAWVDDAEEQIQLRGMGGVRAGCAFITSVESIRIKAMI